jgi:hypothetical protein
VKQSEYADCFITYYLDNDNKKIDFNYIVLLAFLERVYTSSTRIIGMIKKNILLFLILFVYSSLSGLSTLEGDLMTLIKKLGHLNTGLASISEVATLEPRMKLEATPNPLPLPVRKPIKFASINERFKFLLDYPQKYGFKYEVRNIGYIFFVPQNFKTGMRSETGPKDFFSIKAYLFPDIHRETRELNSGLIDQDEFDHYVLKKKDKAQQAYLRAAQTLASNYKIHLMPKDDDQMIACIKKLLQEWKTNADLQRVLHDFKVGYFDIEVSQKEKDEKNILPRIVIYPASGKQNAQATLNIIYKLLKDIKGADIYPRYNAKVTSLIYVAQGDADYKSDSALYFGGEIYELPKKVYYAASKIPPEDGKDHYLRHPGTGEPLIN